MVHNFVIISCALVFSGCVSIEKKSATIESSSSIAQSITDKTILYWKLGLDNVASGINKGNEISRIKYEFEDKAKSNIKLIHNSLTTSCNERDLLLLENLLNRSLELVHKNDSGKIGETFFTLTKEVRQSCKETWFNWFISCEDIMKKLIYKYSATPSSDRP